MIYFNVFLLLTIFVAINCDPLNWRDCGPEDRYIKYNSVNIAPYPIVYPGSVKLAMDMDVTHDISDQNIMTQIVLEKLTPQRMLIPCIGDLGSCTYNFCTQALKSFNQLFAQFGTKCPLTAGKYSNKGADVDLPTFGTAFDKVFEGNFEGNVTFFDGPSKKVYGCVHLQFTIQLK